MIPRSPLRKWTRSTRLIIAALAWGTFLIISRFYVGDETPSALLYLSFSKSLPSDNDNDTSNNTLPSLDDDDDGIGDLPFEAPNTTNNMTTTTTTALPVVRADGPFIHSIEISHPPNQSRGIVTLRTIASNNRSLHIRARMFGEEIVFSLDFHRAPARDEEDEKIVITHQSQYLAPIRGWYRMELIVSDVSRLDDFSLCVAQLEHRNDSLLVRVDVDAPSLQPPSPPSAKPDYFWRLSGDRHPDTLIPRLVEYTSTFGSVVDRNCAVASHSEAIATSARKIEARFCFAGDSHMRYAYTALLKELEVFDLDNFPLLHPSPHLLKYYYVVFPEHIKENLDNMGECQVVFVNFGQWELALQSYRSTLSRPWNLRAYVESVKTAVEQMLSRLSSRAQIVWLAIEPCPVFYIYECPPKDFRWYPRVEIYNEEAEKLIEEISKVNNNNNTSRRLRFLDAYRTYRPVSEFTFDTCHYIPPLTDAVRDEALRIMYPKCEVKRGSNHSVFEGWKQQLQQQQQQRAGEEEPVRTTTGLYETHIQVLNAKKITKSQTHPPPHRHHPKIIRG